MEKNGSPQKTDSIVLISLLSKEQISRLKRNLGTPGREWGDGEVGNNDLIYSYHMLIS